MIAGHRRNIHYFERVLTNGTFAHAYLFHGPEAVGKKTAALAVAASLLCAHRAPFGGCGQCEDCRSVRALRHPDLVFLAPDHLLVEEPNRREMGIKNARELERVLTLAPWSGQYKVVIIDGADALSTEAQSALLKTIEEPSGRAVLIFITSVPEALLATIRSRTVPIGFSTLADGELAELLADAPGRERAGWIALAAGRPGVALRLLRDATFRKELQSSAIRFARTIRSGLGKQFEISEAASRDPGGTEQLLEALIRTGRQNLITALDNPRRADASRIAALVSFLLEKLALARTTTANRRLLADSAFFEWQSVLHA